MITRTVFRNINAIVHSNRMDEVPDEHLAEILPLAKKIAKAQGLVNYNILQVRISSYNLRRVRSDPIISYRTTARLRSSMSSTSTSTSFPSQMKRRVSSSISNTGRAKKSRRTSLSRPSRRSRPGWSSDFKICLEVRRGGHGAISVYNGRKEGYYVYMEAGVRFNEDVEILNLQLHPQSLRSRSTSRKETGGVPVDQQITVIYSGGRVLTDDVVQGFDNSGITINFQVRVLGHP